MKRECLTIIGTAHVSEESVNEVKDTVRVVPMKKITELMDYAIRFGKDMEESSGFNQ